MARQVHRRPSPTRLRMARQEAVELLLPECPSANVYWRRHGNILHVSNEARAYKQAVRMLTMKYRTNGECAFPSGDLSLVIVWHRSAKRGDLSNRVKVCEDALEGSIYANDRQVAHLEATRCDDHPTVPLGYMHVSISRLTMGNG